MAVNARITFSASQTGFYGAENGEALSCFKCVFEIRYAMQTDACNTLRRACTAAVYIFGSFLFCLTQGVNPTEYLYIMKTGMPLNAG